ncbi:MAG: hypothetical protein Q7T81_17735 [Pseudolabrys sp.]|nr:hypothetical protein [Pseudolabrys sp.]
MSSNLESSGFASPVDRALVSERRGRVLTELFAICGLVVSIIIAATVVSVGVARASIVDGVIDNEGGLFAVALLLGILFIGIGGFSLLPPREKQPRH